MHLGVNNICKSKVHHKNSTKTRWENGNTLLITTHKVLQYHLMVDCDAVKIYTIIPKATVKVTK